MTLNPNTEQKLVQTRSRFGFMKQRDYAIPENFDELYQKKIIDLFFGNAKEDILANLK